MSSRHVGIPHTRREDPALVTGEANYTDDYTPPETVHVSFVRSQYGHARIENVDAADAMSKEGVHAVYTATDLADSIASTTIRATETLPGQKAPEYPLIADEVVRYMGDIVAVVVAENRYIAADAVEAVAVEYDRLEAVTDARAALEGGAPTLHEYAPDNCGLDWSFGDDEDEVTAIFDDAAHVVDVETHNQRLHADAMEPRAILAEYDGDAGELTVTMATQAPFLERSLIAGALGLEEEDVRVVAPAVGGGFGSKALPYPDQVLLSWVALQLERPAKWVATRTESHLADHHGRDFHTRGKLALDDSGRVLAFQTDAIQNLGAYLVYATSPAPNYEHLASGAYAIPKIHGHLRGAFTNTAPVAPYRGAGRPEIVFLLERLMDEAAAELGLDPAEIRRRNFIPPEAFPYDTPVSATYDSGDYETALQMALDEVDYEQWRTLQREVRDEGRYLGIGVASFVENSGNGPGVPETGYVEFTADGTVIVATGTADHGQGHATAFSAVVADELGIDPADVEVRAGDTALPGTAGTFGSRSAAIAGSAIAESAAEVREKAQRVAAHELEASPDDLMFSAGAFHPKGAPERSIDIREVARRAAAMPPSDEYDVDLSATTLYDPENFTYPFGTHVAVVEVDPDTGEVGFHRYVAVDDCGTQLNPTIVEGQVMGGIAQGIGQALYEQTLYDENGSLLTGSLQDYALPKATHIPSMTIEDTVTPSPHNPTGAKGVGEGGAIVSPAAVVNAIIDALRPLGIDSLEMPLTEETIWRGVQEHSG